MYCSSKRHGVNINMTKTSFEVKKFFLKRNKQKQSLICLKNCEMNNFLAILELCAFYIEYKKVKFTAINFLGRISLKYFMQIQLLRFCKVTTKVSSLPLLKITTKSTHFLPAKKKIPILTPRYQIPTPSGKKFANCKYFFEKCE